MSSYVYRIIAIGVYEMQEIMMGVGVMNTPEYPVGWSRLADFPGAIRGHAATIVGDSLYVFGGYLSNGNTDRLWRYDILSDQWEEISQPATRPPARIEHDMVAMGNLLYLYAGIAGTRMGDLWRYDTNKNIWTALATGLGCQSPRMLVKHNEIVVIGGGPAANVPQSSTHRIYTPDTNTWRLSEPYPSVIYSHGACELNGEIWVYAGYNGSVQQDQIRVFRSEHWNTSMAPIPPGRSSMRIQAIKGLIYSFGGSPTPGANRFVRYDPVTKTWVPIEEAPPSRYAHTLNSWQDKMIMVGGITFTAVNEVWLYNPG